MRSSVPTVPWAFSFTMATIFASPPVAVQIALPTKPAVPAFSWTKAADLPGASGNEGMFGGPAGLPAPGVNVQATLVVLVPTFATAKPVNNLMVGPAGLRSIIKGMLTLLVADDTLMAS